MVRQLLGSLGQGPLLGMALLVAFLAVGDGAVGQGRSGFSAQTIEQIVNDEPISTYDIDARMRLVLTTAGQAATPESLGRIRHQVLETLIDETVQLQEAKRLGVKVEDLAIQNAIATIEKSNRLAPGTLVPNLTKAGVDISTLVAQIRATVAWRQVISSQTVSKVTVTEAEIDQYLNDLGKKGGSEYLLAEIFVAAPRPQDLPLAKATANDLIQKIRTGVQFPTLARQFSQAPSAGAGGDMGWVEADQLDPRMATALKNLPVGQITAPVEVDDGIYILALRERRVFGAQGQEQTLYDVRRYYMPFDPRAPNTVKVAVLRKVQAADREVRTCDDMEPVAKRFGAQSNSMGEVRLADLPGPLRPYIEALKPGEKTKVLPLTDGVMVMMLCNKRVEAAGLPDREKVRQTLLNRRIDVEARQYLRSLRQNALIEAPSRS
jgi:peptidyl-prolyl cis-trans isomerase SurA